MGASVSRADAAKEREIASIIKETSESEALTDERRVEIFREFERILRANFRKEGPVFRTKPAGAAAAASLTANVSPLEKKTFPETAHSFVAFAVGAVWFSREQMSAFRPELSRILAIYFSTPAGGGKGAAGDGDAAAAALPDEVRAAVASLAREPHWYRVRDFVVPGRDLIPAVRDILAAAEAEDAIAAIAAAAAAVSAEDAATIEEAAGDIAWEKRFKEGVAGSAAKRLDEICGGGDGAPATETPSRGELVGFFTALGYKSAATEGLSTEQLCANAKSVAAQFRQVQFFADSEATDGCRGADGAQSAISMDALVDYDARRVLVVGMPPGSTGGAVKRCFLPSDVAGMFNPALVGADGCKSDTKKCKLGGLELSYDDLRGALDRMRKTAVGKGDDAWASGVFTLETRLDVDDKKLAEVFRVIAAPGVLAAAPAPAAAVPAGLTPSPQRATAVAATARQPPPRPLDPRHDDPPSPKMLPSAMARPPRAAAAAAVPVAADEAKQLEALLGLTQSPQRATAVAATRQPPPRMLPSATAPSPPRAAAAVPVAAQRTPARTPARRGESPPRADAAQRRTPARTPARGAAATHSILATATRGARSMPVVGTDGGVLRELLAAGSNVSPPAKPVLWSGPAVPPGQIQQTRAIDALENLVSLFDADGNPLERADRLFAVRTAARLLSETAKTARSAKKINANILQTYLLISAGALSKIGDTNNAQALRHDAEEWRRSDAEVQVIEELAARREAYRRTASARARPALRSALRRAPGGASGGGGK